VVADPVVPLVVPLPGPAIASVFNRMRPFASRQWVEASELEPPGPDIPGGFGDPPGGLVWAIAAKVPAAMKIAIRSFDMAYPVD
jgi:hypothetical protein